MATGAQDAVAVSACHASEHPQSGMDFFHSADFAEQVNRHILLHFPVDAAANTHDSVHGGNGELAALERSLPDQTALGDTDDIDIVDDIGEPDEIGHSEV